ncbi:MAG TPA: PspC domain-containing protein [Nocardioides sp.]|nr:PspC domain-containing protein [Nocardioides sp.]
MTTTPPDTSPGQPQGPDPAGHAGDSGPRVGWDDIRDLARIRRSRTDRKVAGVAGGLGRHLDVDPVILRVAFVVLTFFGGVGLLLYVALWLLLPEDGSDWAKIKLDRRSRTVALVIVGAVAALLLVSHGWWGDPGPFFFLVLVVAVIVIATQLPRRDRHDVPPPGATPYAGSAGPATEPGQASFAAPADQTATYPTYPDAGYPPPSYAAPEQPRPVNPRKNGPILFWFALGTMAVALGALGVADLAGADIAPSAYPATVLGLSAAWLLLGSFFGRAGGLILVGLVAAAATVGSTFADHWDPHSSTVVPADAAAVHSTYSMDVGEIVLDLTAVSDPQALDGRQITVDGNVGHLDIRVPAGVSVVSENHVTGIGGINAFGRDAGGVDTSLTAVHSAGAGAPHLTVVTDLHIGGIDVHVGSNR